MYTQHWTSLTLFTTTLFLHLKVYVISFSEEYYVAMYNYISGEPADLSFNQGEIITVTKKDGDWWTGTSGDKNGIFPANYVKKMETQVS